MKFIIQKCVIAGCAVLTAAAQIDSGGGKAQVGSLTNHGSLGGTVASGTVQAGAVTNHSGLIEVLYAASFTTEADANSNDIPDSWEQEYFAGQGFDDEVNFGLSQKILSVASYSLGRSK